MADTCSTCHFWVPNDEPQGVTSVHGWGECRRYPPQVVMALPGRQTTVWPITTGELGCGEHKLVLSRDLDDQGHPIATGRRRVDDWNAT